MNFEGKSKDSLDWYRRYDLITCLFDRINFIILNAFEYEWIRNVDILDASDDVDEVEVGDVDGDEEGDGVDRGDWDDSVRSTGADQDQAPEYPEGRPLSEEPSYEILADLTDTPRGEDFHRLSKDSSGSVAVALHGGQEGIGGRSTREGAWHARRQRSDCSSVSAGSRVGCGRTLAEEEEEVEEGRAHRRSRIVIDAPERRKGWLDWLFRRRSAGAALDCSNDTRKENAEVVEDGSAHAELRRKHGVHSSIYLHNLHRQDLSDEWKEVEDEREDEEGEGEEDRDGSSGAVSYGYYPEPPPISSRNPLTSSGEHGGFEDDESLCPGHQKSFRIRTDILDASEGFTDRLEMDTRRAVLGGPSLSLLAYPDAPSRLGHMTNGPQRLSRGRSHHVGRPALPRPPLVLSRANRGDRVSFLDNESDNSSIRDSDRDRVRDQVEAEFDHLLSPSRRLFPLHVENFGYANRGPAKSHEYEQLPPRTAVSPPNRTPFSPRKAFDVNQKNNRRPRASRPIATSGSGEEDGSNGRGWGALKSYCSRFLNFSYSFCCKWNYWIRASPARRRGLGLPAQCEGDSDSNTGSNRVKKGKRRRPGSFELFWTMHCKYYAVAALWCYYIGTGFLLLSIANFMYATFLIKYSSTAGAWIGVILIVISLTLGLGFAFFVPDKPDG